MTRIVKATSEEASHISGATIRVFKRATNRLPSNVQPYTLRTTLLYYTLLNMVSCKSQSTANIEASLNKAV